ncbi:ferric reductase-like transmembrane domain-containing protein [Streptomyces griseoloalbus]|uniref:DMSO/TMAO reductase YedYZ heme-binding membrane subunit n=1 Tax=Streptomyces griseoloalbus TaxID=67303 RepID=A0A7W8F718_9ACTN|nr:ferric reductase-like transmembrane domain-containing protein [Streptomyces albaduncus]MBB5123724.1 DMSO/TMAO reductase YedYZ heme-binding membrane subunit [Streptomyces albaduncus]GGW40918.1 membrane protein [Streptomyces albaduncus]
MRPDDSTADDWLAEFLGFGVGVLSLVCLSCSVIWGLVAQDRILLGPRQRILAQAVHRTTAVASIVFLLMHIGIKVAQEHTSWIAAVIPFGLALTDDEAVTGRTFLIGLGTLAGLLMFFVGITGALRNRFASPAPVAARWRAMHMLAYPAWCAALVHGLYAGREAKPVFVILYGLSVAGVTAALVLRASPRPVKRRIAGRITSLLGPTEQRDRENLEESRSRAAGSALPGHGGRRASARGDERPRGGRPLYETAERAAAPEPANGFAAAYRAVSTPAPSPWQTPLTGGTARMELPPDLQRTEAMPRVDGPSSTSGNWPIPSPPPVGEAPPSAYDPLNDTGYTVPAYDNSVGSGYGSSDVYDTAETNTLYGTYNPSDTYNSGPATETLPGASPSSSYDFDAPGSGEPWNTPSGGFK